MLFCYLLAPIVSDEKSTVNLLGGGVPYMYVMSFLSLLSRVFLCLWLSLVLLWFILVWILPVYPVYNSFSLLDVKINFLNQIWEVFSHHFSKYSASLILFSPSEITIIPMLVELMVFHQFSEPLLCLLLCFSFLFHWLSKLSWTIFKFTASLFCQLKSAVKHFYRITHLLYFSTPDFLSIFLYFPCINWHI